VKLKYFAIKKEIQKCRLSIKHINIDLMIVGHLTKGLMPKLFASYVENMGIMCTIEC